MKLVVTAILFLMMTFVASSGKAATWLAIDDSTGVTWARVLITNNSETDSNWSISGCRTAVASDADAATVDEEFDWDGVVEAGTSEYVWVYGKDIGDINVANADGDASAYIGTVSLDNAGDGELTIVVSAEGTSSVSVEPADAYGAPTVAGGLPQ